MRWLGLNIIALLYLIDARAEALLKEGHCPSHVKHKNPVELDRLVGTWYSQFRSPRLITVMSCIRTWNYHDPIEGYYMKSSGIDPIDKAPTVKRFKLFDFRKGEFKLKRFIPLKTTGAPVINWIVDTDYTTFTVRFSCYNTGDSSHHVLALQTRQQFPSAMLIKKMKTIALLAGFSLKDVQRVKQVGCGYD